MNFRITHSTVYSYNQTVRLCQNEARLKPRDFWRQSCQSNAFQIIPTPTDFQEHTDYFGNQVAYFAIQSPHSQLEVTTVSEVQIFPKPPTRDLFNPMSWEQVRDLLNTLPLQTLHTSSEHHQRLNSEILDARQYLLDSPMITADDRLALFAQQSFMPGRPLVDVVQDLMQRIYTDFTYDPSFTTIATPLSEVLSHKRGVCQDFAHLAIGCLRCFGIAARYISGYVETEPQQGIDKLAGSDASHAWFAVYIPGSGWLEFDPTNNKLPLDQHITLAWGRDFSDVTPLKGIAVGGGQHTLTVSVEVSRVSS